MSPELDQHIREKYPLIFPNNCEMSIGDGWFDIIDKLCSNIQGHIEHISKQRKWNTEWNERVNDPDHKWTSFVPRETRAVPELVEQVVAVQVKEKFGTLRFYYTGGDDYIRGLEAMADSMSAVICEDCGKPGKLRSGGWVRTLCDGHAEEKEIRDELRNRSV